MNAIDIYLKQLFTISFTIALITGCATTDYLGEKPDDFTNTLPPVSLPKDEENTPPAEEIKPEPPAEEKKSTIYLVRAGDTLYSISQRHGYSITQLAEWNHLNPPYILSVGQELIVSPPPPPVVVEVNLFTHKVAQGETLYAIAKLYGCPITELITLNHLAPPYSLTVGQNLQIPQ